MFINSLNRFVLNKRRLRNVYLISFPKMFVGSGTAPITKMYCYSAPERQLLRARYDTFVNFPSHETRFTL